MTAAERARRYRERKKAEDAPEQPKRSAAVTVASHPDARDGVTLSRAGRRLWSELDGDESTGSTRALIVEACRLADRLDRLDRQLRSRDFWMRFRVNGDATEVTVVIDKPLAEARQQAVALKQVLSELRQAGATGQSAPRRGQGGQARTSGTGAHGQAKGGGSVIADLAAYVANKQATG